MLKLIMVSQLILSKSKKILLFNFTRIDFGYFFLNYIFKSDFDQYYPNINHFSDQITKQKSLYSKSNLTKSISTKFIVYRINSIKVKPNILLVARALHRHYLAFILFLSY